MIKVFFFNMLLKFANFDKHLCDDFINLAYKAEMDKYTYPHTHSSDAKSPLQQVARENN